ncbi:MAG: protein-glutamate O-methyltransferase CheR [Deltaproteobacteria bacterium]|nr:protein-glutamate O-methyltransferase CheR [Deltaproteobacteria bacterium]
MSGPERLDGALLDRLVDVVRTRTRLLVSERNLGAIATVAAQRLAALALPAEQYVDRVSASSPDSGELEMLTRELTVGETYFFRGPVFAALRDVVLPELVAERRREGSLRLRMLSAGCASGEEAYSLAMLLSETLPDLERWDTSVIGIDLNTTFLRKAEVGEYGSWSLRDVDASRVARHFENRGSTFRVAPAVRRLVRFHYCNLAIDSLPAPGLGVFGMDVIVCQNVLYYFDRGARRTVIEKLVECTAQRGTLFFGAADLAEPSVPGCQARTIGDTVAYRRPSSTASSTPARDEGEPVARLSPRPSPHARRGSLAASSSPPPIDARGLSPQRGERQAEGPARPLSRQLGERQGEGRSTDAATHPIGVDDLDDLGDVVALANDGDLRGAVARVEEILSTDGEAPRAHALHGLLLSELGELRAALDAFRRALYLDPALLVAHAGSTMVARRLGDGDLARRFGTRLVALAGARPVDEPVDGWKGMTVGRLLRLFDEPVDGVAR